MNETDYQHKLEEIFARFPSVQKSGFAEAYKPGLAHMEAFDALLGGPSRDFRSVHVAGTNGKGSVANMLASALAATGLKVGLYTSPHILDFRERMRILDAGSDGPARLIGRQEVWDFICRWEEDFDRLELSFFEITTGLAFRWFADEQVDIAVIEVGLGGRLDSTNVITPEVAVVTSIGLDHCAQLGGTRAAIAGEKAGIFKPGVPAVVGTWDAETAPVFEARAASLPCPLFFAFGEQGGCSGISSAFGGQGDGGAVASASAKCSTIPLPSSSIPQSQASPLHSSKLSKGGSEPEMLFANAKRISAFQAHCLPQTLEDLLPEMDLQGEWQEENLRTALTVLAVMGVELSEEVLQAIAHTARRMDFHGRWEMLRRNPDILCDIGHNPPALERNFAELRRYLAEGRYERLIIVYGIMADKDLDGIIPLMPLEAEYIAVAPDTARALAADALCARLRAGLTAPVRLGGSVTSGLELALEAAAEGPGADKEGKKTLIYVGGSTFVVSEAVTALLI